MAIVCCRVFFYILYNCLMCRRDNSFGLKPGNLISNSKNTPRSRSKEYGVDSKASCSFIPGQYFGQIGENLPLGPSFPESHTCPTSPRQGTSFSEALVSSPVL